MADCLKNGQLFFPVGDMNFTRNCTATVSYCKNYIAIPGPGSFRPTNKSVWDEITLFRASLPARYAQVDNVILLAAGNFIRQDRNFSWVVDAAARDCALEECRALNYPGNGDMAGDRVRDPFLVSITVFGNIADRM